MASTFGFGLPAPPAKSAAAAVSRVLGMGGVTSCAARGAALPTGMATVAAGVERAICVASFSQTAVRSHAVLSAVITFMAGDVFYAGTVRAISCAETVTGITAGFRATGNYASYSAATSVQVVASTKRDGRVGST